MAEPTPENAAADSSAAEAAIDPASLSPELAAALAAATDGPAAPVIDQMASGGQMASEMDDAADIDLSHLPVHTRSLLKIRVAVTVTLANQRRPIHEITELGPGTIVKFEKTYDQPLELTVGELPIASGDVVKVGDKFGLRIGRIIQPHERFASVG